MRTDRMKVFMTREAMWGDTIAVRIGHKVNNQWAVAQSVQYRVLTPDDAGKDYPACFQFNKDDAQSFMDELWNVGIRPTEGSGSAGSLAATERHLQDMRALVFKTEAAK